MKNYILKTALLCTFFILFSCKKPEAAIKPQIIPGVVLSFDDAYVNEWFNTDQELKQYGWKGTFCVSKINTLGHSEIKNSLNYRKKDTRLLATDSITTMQKSFLKNTGLRNI